MSPRVRRYRTGVGPRHWGWRRGGKGSRGVRFVVRGGVGTIEDVPGRRLVHRNFELRQYD